jgi:hypothetical protein
MLTVALFPFEWRHVSQCRVESGPVVVVDPGEDGESGVGSGRVAISVDELAFEGGPEGLGDGVVPCRQLLAIPMVVSGVRVTHPFHPWHGRKFVLLSVRQTWSQDRVFFLDVDGRQYSLPVGWIDAVEPDVFVTAAAGRCPFRFADLAALAGLLDGQRGAEGSEEL